MRYRDYFSITIPFLILTILYCTGVLGQLGFSSTSEEINRDDSKRVNTVLLREREWAEFHISPDAKGISLMTNAALQSKELPQINQSDPRVGFRYSIEYQLLDADGELIRTQIYHSRTRLRQLIDADNGELINPLVFGKTGQTATQTRFVQIPIHPSSPQPAVIRVRMNDADPQISELAARVRTKHERPHFDEPSTWKQISLKSRRRMSRFCVFDQKFLTRSERASLLRWRWQQAPPLNQVTFRYLYFIGEIDDQEVNEQVSSGSNTLTPSNRTTLPMPEMNANLKLSFQRVNSKTTRPIYITTRFFPSNTDNKKRPADSKNPSDTISWDVEMQNDTKEITIPVGGGLVEFETTDDVTWTATWKHDDPDGGSIEIDGQQITYGQTAEMHSNSGNLRVYLADDVPVTYSVSHLGNQPTPFRITCRIAYGDAFASDESQKRQQENEGSFDGWHQLKNLQWEWLDGEDNTIDEGEVSVEPEISAYDQLWRSGEPHLISEYKRYYFSIPPEATKIRFHSRLMPFLINASVRPNQLPVVTRLPEDHQPYQRQFKRERKWFNLQPQENLSLISANRSFVIRTQIRPREAEEDAPLEPQELKWERYEPNGSWIGRQLLAPSTIESVVTRSNAPASFYEMENRRNYAVEDYGLDANESDNFRLIYINPSNQQGDLTIKQNGVVIDRKRLVSSRGNIGVQLQPFEKTTTIKLEGPDGIRAFLSGAKVVDAKRFLKRTASKLENGQLEFEYEKKSDLDEALTLLIYRKSSSQDRCQISIEISADEEIQLLKSGPAESLTSLHQIYDLQSRPQQQSAILIGTDAELDVEHRCFIRLGPDLPRGRYKIKTERIDGKQDGFVLLYQSTPVINGNNSRSAILGR